MEKEARILVVDDEQDLLDTCRKILSLRGFEVDLTDSARQALELFQEREYELVIVDLKMPLMDGMELLGRLRRIRPEQLVVMITAYASVDNALEAVQSGAFDFVRKPFRMNDLLLVVQRALRYKALQDQNQRLQQELRQAFAAEEVVGESPALRQALSRLRKVSEVDVPVLIVGESGTGKELFAKTIHRNSPRSDGPFLAVDCAALPETLLESELFGYEKGAFTGAVQRKAGLFEAASGGTLLLDEIGEMPLSLQGKLLRALEEGRIRRLGSNREIPVNVRILGATHRNLEEMVEQGVFREDLYYRLNVVQVVVPPLREREGDVRLLADFFFRRFCKKLSKRVDGISAAALLVLEEYDWPGNVRELRNAIERAATLTESCQILPQDLPPAILEAVEEKKGLSGQGDFQESKRALINQFEEEYVRKMLARCQGNVTEAARYAGLSRQAFYRLMAKYGLSSAAYKAWPPSETNP